MIFFFFTTQIIFKSPNHSLHFIFFLYNFQIIDNMFNYYIVNLKMIYIILKITLNIIKIKIKKKKKKNKRNEKKKSKKEFMHNELLNTYLFFSIGKKIFFVYIKKNCVHQSPLMYKFASIVDFW